MYRSFVPALLLRCEVNCQWFRHALCIMHTSSPDYTPPHVGGHWRGSWCSTVHLVSLETSVERHRRWFLSPQPDHSSEGRRIHIMPSWGVRRCFEFLELPLSRALALLVIISPLGVYRQILPQVYISPTHRCVLLSLACDALICF